ncbi:MAG: response regulator [Potamolinea sp.]
MQSEQQQRIMGYFIEEAKDHLNTIEQGLLSLQSTMEDKAMREEVYRAAHSVKGGAGMLGVGSIHKTAHKLEDCFKYLEKALEESPVQVDPHLESLFLQVYDTLEALVEQLETPFGLTDETANYIMSDAEPVFQELNTHLVQLVSSAKTATVATTQAPKVAMKKAQPIQEKSTAQPMSFKRDVLIGLREMLELFKQQDLPENRQKLQENCTHLRTLGEELKLSGWCELLNTSKQAIACEENPYRLLASVVIKEIKEAQELVMTGRSVEIAPSEQLKALVSETSTSQEPEIDYYTQSLSTETADVQSNEALNDIPSATNLFNTPDTYIQKDISEESKQQNLPADRQETGEWSIAYGEEFALETNQSSPTSFSQQEEETFNHPSSIYNQSRIGSAALTNFAEPSEPEVGIAELNSLADIFEGQTPDLDETWQEEEIIMLEDNNFANTPEQLFSLDEQSDFSDLIGEEHNSELPTVEEPANDDWMGWLSDDATEEVGVYPQESTEAIFSDHNPTATPFTTDSAPYTVEDVLFQENNLDSDFSDLLFENDSSESFLSPTSDAGNLNALFGDRFLEEDSSVEENNESTSSEDSFFLELDDLGSDERLEEEVIFTSSVLDFNDLLESSDSETLATKPSEQAQELFAFDELLFDEPSEDFEFSGLRSENQSDISLDEGLFDFSSSNTESLTDFSQETLFFTDEQNGLPTLNSESETEETLESLNLDFDLDTTATSALELEDETEETLESLNLDFDLDTTSTSALELEDETEETLESLNLDFDLDTTSTSALELEDEAEETLESLNLDFDLDTTSTSALELEDETEETLESLNLDFDLDTTSTSALELEDEAEETLESLNLDFDLDTTSTSALELEDESRGEIDELWDNPTLSSVELLDNQAEESLEDEGFTLDYLDNFEELFGSPTADTETSAIEAIERESLETSEAIPEIDSLTDFLDIDSETTDSSALEDLSIFQTLAETDNADSTVVENSEALDLGSLLLEETPEDTNVLDTLQEDLFDSSIAFDSNLEPETAENFRDWEETENLEDFLSMEVDEVTDTQSAAVAIPEASEWDFELEEEEQTVREEELDWATTDSESFGQQSPMNLEAIALTSLGAGLMLGSLAANEYTDVAKSQGTSEDSLQSSSELEDEWEGLDDLLAEDNQARAIEDAPLEQALVGEFDDLEAMLAQGDAPANADIDMFGEDMFGELESLLGEQTRAPAESLAPAKTAAPSKSSIDDEFGDMERLLEQAEQTMGGPPKRQSSYQQPASSVRGRPPSSSARKPDQTIRVPVKHLDNLSNLVGELVVNRNSLEQDQERLRQFLDNLSHQVMALSDVGARMQDLYERTLLESSLLASRYNYRTSFSLDRAPQNNNSSDREYDPLEMDRFTGFHLLSQEMIELIVRVRESASDIEFLVDETDQVARMLRQVTTQLSEGLMRGRMVPFAQTTDRLPRAVREISLKLGKQAELQVDGRETLIDKLILEHLSDPLTHLVNNALTHGIETPEIRQAAGKPRAGRITLKAFHQGNQTVIAISDDGAGINPEIVRTKAIEKKLITPAQARTLTPLDLYEFLFHPGFSTKDKADDFSGRGVGMDVVLTSLSEIRGTIHIDSTLGKGTTFTIRLPLVLSICKALSCLSDKARIAFPMDGVEDTLDVSPAHVQINSEGKTCIPWRDTLLTFQPLAELLKYNRHLSRGTVYGGKREDDRISIVVLRSAGNFLAIQVDQVLGQQEIVIKQLEGPAPKPVGIAGATVLGDGRIMPIADVLELIELSRGRIRPDGEVRIWSREGAGDLVPEEPSPTKVEPMVLIVDDSITVRSLLEMTFSKAGYRVEQARDGQEAWDKLRSGLPCDIVFCDIEMPRMDGLELLSRLQKDENMCHLPIAMLTSRGSQRHQQMASELGARGYFIKPYLEEVLLDAAQRMIKGEVLLTSKSNA